MSEERNDKEVIKLTKEHRNVICPKCGKADRLEYNRVLRHISTTVGAGGGATFGGLGIEVGGIIGSAICPGVGTAVGATLGGLSGVIAGYVTGYEAGSKIGEKIEQTTKQKFRCHRCRITFKK